MYSKTLDGMTVLKRSAPLRWTRQESQAEMTWGIFSLGSKPVNRTLVSPLSAAICSSSERRAPFADDPDVDVVPALLFQHFGGGEDDFETVSHADGADVAADEACIGPVF